MLDQMGAGPVHRVAIALEGLVERGWVVRFDAIHDDGFIDGDNDKDGILDPSETWVYTATYEVTADDLLQISIDNTATADSAESGAVTASVSVPVADP